MIPPEITPLEYENLGRSIIDLLSKGNRIELYRSGVPIYIEGIHVASAPILIKVDQISYVSPINDVPIFFKNKFLKK